MEAHQLPALRAAFTEALERFRELLMLVRYDLDIPEPWLGDEVSIETHDYYVQRVLQGTPYRALCNYLKELERVHDALRAAEDSYRQVEGDNAARWKRAT